MEGLGFSHLQMIDLHYNVYEIIMINFVLHENYTVLVNADNTVSYC